MVGLKTMCRGYNIFMTGLSLTLFGVPQITHGDRQLVLQRRKDLALLVYLVVTAQPHSRDTLATLLWPDADQSTARANIRKSLSRIKSDLGADVLLATNNQVALNPDISLWLDVYQFHAYVEQARKHNHGLQGKDRPLCNECQTALQEAVQLYRGDFMEGFSLPDSSTFDEWQFFQTDGYRQQLSGALQHLGQQHIALGEYDSAVEYGRKWLALDMFNEPAHRQLMLAYALGGQQSAALRQFEECSRLLSEELGTEPEPETVDLHEAIRTKKLNRLRETNRPKVSLATNPLQETFSSSQSVRVAHNLPVTTTPFVGRTKELGRIKELFNDPSSRVVTLLGPGGSGKTRLAIQTGASYHGEHAFRDGVWFIQLAPLKYHTSIIPAIQDGLKLSACVGPENPRQQLFNYLGNRQALLILDNFEHLLHPESVKLISDLIHHAPQTKILITSRERLSIHGENLFPVEGLTTPTNEAVLSGLGVDSEQRTFASIQLFEQSAQRVQPAFMVTNDNIGTVAQICLYLQGMPLAIELAAAWIEVLPLDEIFKEIKQDLDFLKSELHDTPDRQRSLRAVFDTSWVKLGQPTRSTIKALSVFRSNFSREAAQAITGLSAKTLLELTNKSWIQPQENGKYQIHELLRQFAHQALENEPVTYTQVRERYCNYYANRLAVLWELSKGSEQSKFYKEMEFEYENIKTAWDWLEEQGNFDSMVDNMLAALFAYSEIRGKSLELMGLCERAVNRLEKSTTNANKNRLEIILRTVEGAFWKDGHPLRYENFDGVYPINQASVQRAWELSQASGGLHRLGYWGILLAFIHGHLIDRDTVIGQLEAMLPFFQADNDLWNLANAKMHLARLFLETDGQNGKNTSEAVRGYLTEALEIFKSLGDNTSSGQALRLMGNLSLREQSLKEAIRQWQKARANLLAVDVNEWWAASSINWQIGDAYLQQGQFDEAFQCFQETSRVNLAHGFIRQAVGALSKESFEKARYGDLQDAIRLRQQCLDLIQQTGQGYQVSWNLWEMGELMRLTGQLDAAIHRFEEAFKIFDTFSDNMGRSFYWRGMGDILLARYDLQEASNAFLKCLECARAAHHEWMTAYALNGLGRVQLYMNDIRPAGEQILAALNLARKAHDPGITLTILDSLSAFHARQGNHEKAASLNIFVLQHFATWNEIKARASQLSESLRQKYLPREFNELKKKAQSVDLWDVVNQELSEFKENV